MSFCRQHEFVQDGAEARDPPLKTVGFNHLDPSANALPIIRCALDCNSRNAANTSHYIGKVTGKAIHEDYFTGSSNCGCLVEKSQIRVSCSTGSLASWICLEKLAIASSKLASLKSITFTLNSRDPW